MRTPPLLDDFIHASGCKPICGKLLTLPGGHILVHAFDVLMQMYKDAGYSQRDAAKSILENNIKVNAGRISGTISTTTKNYIVNYQDLQGIGMTVGLQ